MPRKAKNKAVLPVNVFSRLMDIFDGKYWRVKKDVDNDASLFTRISNCLSHLNYDQQMLILYITENFIKFCFEEYGYHLKKALELAI